ncbi:Der1-like family [Achlya hypogyna]|uniref:Derlin n=1 Tax=Achlya hypogyna TaxID=1202772 RepID=A0A1V9ZK49_ACHHY|nr:Der1-like family [Achlya hypogyna]
MNDPLEWYYEIPVISRLYLTGAFLTTAACALELISPFSLYFNFNLIFYRGQVWRLVTNFLFFGLFSLDFLFHMYFLVRYSRMLEEGSFRGRTADFLYMILFGAAFMIVAIFVNDLLVAPFVSVHFLGSSLTFMMVYIWGRRNEHTRLSFLGLFPFTAPYLPWVLLLFSMVLGNSATIDLIGIVVGHIYYFFEDVYPAIADIRGWRVRRVLKTPAFVYVAEVSAGEDTNYPRRFLCNPHGFTMGQPQPQVINDVAVEEHLHQE